jgi:hypothetical protein
MSKNTNLSFLTDYITADITNGRIGINNASPTVAFDVTGIARVSGNMGIGGGTPSIFTGYSVASFGSLSTTSNGITIASTTTGNGLIEFADGTTGNQAYRGYLQYAHTADSLSFGTAGSDRMIITSAGNVGIGTNAPNYNLHINDSGTGGILQFTSSATGTTTSDGLLVGLGDSGAALFLNRENTPMLFYTNNTERMRILSGGNVGIGTTTPGQKLDVNGNIRAAGAFVQATGNIYVGDWVGFFDVSTSTSKVYLLQLVPTETIPLLNYRLFGVIQTNTVSGTYYFTSIASQTMEVRFVGNTIQARITNGNGYYFNWSITQLC